MRQTIYYLPGHGGQIGAGLGKALLERGFDVVGRETLGAFKALSFGQQVDIVADDLKNDYWREDAMVIANSFGGYLFLSAQAQLSSFVGRVILLSPIVGEFANETTMMNFIPARAEQLRSKVKLGDFPRPRDCQVHVGAQDWQSNPKDVSEFGRLTGIPVHIVEGSGHMLDRGYVSDLLDVWLL